MLREALLPEIQTELNRWSLGTRVYGTLYPTIRVFLIIASATVAVESQLAQSPANFLVQWVPVLALLVTILTALDTWVKPREKWRGFMEDRDNLTDLMIKLRSEEKDDPDVLDRFRSEFAQLRKQHREKNVY